MSTELNTKKHDRDMPAGTGSGFRVAFVIGGAQKCGTTALYRYLRCHPALFMPQEKELHCFDKEAKFERNLRCDFANYHASFGPIQSGQIAGEATPAYLYFDDAPLNIWHYNPAMKWLIVLRNPVDRAYSHWNMSRQRSKDPLSFGEAIRQECQRCRAYLPHQLRSMSYVDRGFFVEQIRRLWRHFPESQTHFVKNEDLRDRPGDVLAGVCGFLGVSPPESIASLTAHARDYVEPMSSQDRGYLGSLYEFEIRQLERLLGWDCSDWLDSAAAPVHPSPGPESR